MAMNATLAISMDYSGAVGGRERRYVCVCVYVCVYVCMYVCMYVCAYGTELWNENEEYQEGKKDGGREGGRRVLPHLGEWVTVAGLVANEVVVNHIPVH